MSKEKFRYTAIYDDLRQSIMDGTYEENSLLPTEQSLSMHYDVNRSTLRKAMQLLADEGLIEKKPGKGTIVLSRQSEGSESSEVISNKNIGFLLPRGNLITEPFTLHCSVFWSRTFSRKAAPSSIPLWMMRMIWQPKSPLWDCPGLSL